MTVERQGRWTIELLKRLRESEDKVEFKRGEGGNVAYDGGTRTKPNERRRCILGYVIALCNEKGGTIVIGMEDKYPHRVVGTRQSENAVGELESAIYRDTGIRPLVYELYEDETVKRGRVLVIEVPPRPIGRVYKFEDVALMRVGEELKPMSDEYYCRIIQEQEPDFSQQICEGVEIGDLEQKVFMTSGSGAGTHYSLSDEYKNDSKVLGEALKLGMDEIRRRNVTKNGQDEDENVGK